MLALWNFKIIYPHLDMKLFFLPTVSTGFQAGELGEIYFVRNGEISCRAATQSACVSDQTDYFILVQECGPESQSTQAILKQIGHKSYIYLEFHFCILLRHPRSHISELATAVFTEVLFVLQHRSIGLTCLANVLVLVNASINLPQWRASPPHGVKKITAKIVALQICPNDAWKTVVAFQLMTSSRQERVP